MGHMPPGSCVLISVLIIGGGGGGPLGDFVFEYDY